MRNLRRLPLDRPPETADAGRCCRTAAPRARWGGLLRGARSCARPCAARDHRSLQWRPAAVRERRRRAPTPPQRRGLQLPRAPCGAGAAGHRFRSPTDTRSCSPRTRSGGRLRQPLQRMWASPSRDGREQRLFCARDRSASSPSTIARRRSPRVRERARALLRDPSFGARPKPAAVRDFLAQGYTDHLDESSSPASAVLPAHMFSPRWAASGSTATGRSSRATRRRTRRDVRELFLDRSGSGCAPMSPSARPLRRPGLLGGRGRHRPSVPDRGGEALPAGDRQRTFTVFFEDAGFDERPFAEAVVGQTSRTPIGSRSTTPTWSMCFRSRRGAGRAVRVLEHRRPVARDARGRAAGLKVMLDGQGGDEVLAGYRRPRLPVRRPARRARLRQAAGDRRTFPEAKRAPPSRWARLPPGAARWTRRGKPAVATCSSTRLLREWTPPPLRPPTGCRTGCAELPPSCSSVDCRSCCVTRTGIR